MIHCIGLETFLVFTTTEPRAKVWRQLNAIKPPVAQAAVRSKAMVLLLLLIYCLMYFLLFMGVLCLSLFCYALLCLHSSFAIILKRNRKLFALLLLFTDVLLLLMLCGSSSRCRGLVCDV